MARRLGAHDRQRRRVRRDAASPRRASSPPATSPAGRTRCSTAQLMRLEHWTNATEQGVHAARRLLAGDDAASRSRRCRSSGPTSTTARSRRSASCRPTPSCTSRTARSPSASSSRCSAGAAGSSARSASTGPRLVMQYRQLIAERASWDAALQRAANDLTQPTPAPRARSLTPRFVARRRVRALLLHSRSRCSRRCCPHYVEKSLGARQRRGRDRGRRVRGRRDRAAAVRRPARRLASGRRVLIIGGALIVAVSTAVLRRSSTRCGASSLMRVVTGFGEAGFFVGAATMITDLAPVERRGEAVSYWSVAVYGGLVVRAGARRRVLRGNDALRAHVSSSRPGSRSSRRCSACSPSRSPRDAAPRRPRHLVPPRRDRAGHACCSSG